MLQYRMFVTHFPTHAALVRNKILFVCFYYRLESIIHLQVVMNNRIKMLETIQVSLLGLSSHRDNFIVIQTCFSHIVF